MGMTDIVLITHSDRPIQVVVIFRDMDRIGLLSEILSQHPNDAFARYGLAMEYSKAGEVERSLAEFNQLLSAHPDYTAGYFTQRRSQEDAGKRYRFSPANWQRSRAGGDGSSANGVRIIGENLFWTDSENRKPASLTSHPVLRASLTIAHSTIPGKS